MLTRSAVFIACAFLAACGQQEPASPAAPAAAPAPPPPAATLPRKPAPAGATAYIIEPTDGATVASPVRVVFGLKGIGVAPAGTDRNDEQHRHFGGGQTEVELTLTPGRHTLQLLLGDHLHIPFDPPIASSVVTIEVQ
jgi:hypothetical protein